MSIVERIKRVLFTAILEKAAELLLASGDNLEPWMVEEIDAKAAELVAGA